jgi:hypothetical protein
MDLAPNNIFGNRLEEMALLHLFLPVLNPSSSQLNVDNDGFIVSGNVLGSVPPKSMEPISLLSWTMEKVNPALPVACSIRARTLSLRIPGNDNNNALLYVWRQRFW